MFLNIQIDYLLWLQNLRELSNGFFDPFFLAITHFGEKLIPLLFGVLIYWCLNKKAGEFLLLASSFGILINQILKGIACIERPWILSDKIKPVPDAIAEAAGYSFPSGHTANAMSIWGGLAIWLWDNKIVRYSMITLILLIAFSRNYLGVHTIQDVFVSLVAGIFILLFVKKVFDKVNQNNNDAKILTFAVAFVVLAIAVMVYKYNHLEGARYYSYVSQMPSLYYNHGYVFGFFIGWYLCRKFVPFSTDNMHWLHRILRFLPGAVIVFFLLKYGANPFIEEFGECKGNFFGASVIGLFVTFFYPWIFTKIEKRFNLKGIESIWTKNHL